ncbi:MAG: hypothetical protein WBA12_10610, partial [Catalinimonas sp.]
MHHPPTRRLFCIALLGCALLVGACTSRQPAATSERAYLFYFFEEEAGEKAGLFSAWSTDLAHWHTLTERSFAPQLGEYKVFRDPSVVLDGAGVFHMVWTCGSTGFGYANSQDGLAWENERFVRVAGPDERYEFANVWAPEIFRHGDTTFVIWSSTLQSDYVPPKDPAKWWNATWNHRFYYTTTADFTTFAPTEPFWDPGYNVIDATVHHDGDTFFLFFKDER